MSPDPNCPDCHGTGERDSGGILPWGQPAMVACHCGKPDAEELYSALNDILIANADGKNPEAYWAALSRARDVRDRYRNV